MRIYLKTLLLVFALTNLAHAADLDNKLCPSFFAKIGSALKLYRGKATEDLDSQSFVIFERARIDPNMELTASESSWLKQQGLDSAFAQYRSSGKIVKSLNHVIALSKRNEPMSWQGLSFTQKMQKWSAFFLMGLPVGPRAQAKSIFWKFVNKPEVELSLSDATFIEKWHLGEELDRFRQELKQNRQGFLVMGNIERVGSKLRWSILGSASAGAAILGQSYQKDISAKEAFDDNNSDGIQAAGTVELILPNDSSPPILVVDGYSYIFDDLKITFEKPGQSKALQSLQESRAEHFRIRFRANDEEILALKKRLQEYVSRVITEGGKEQVSTRVYLDDPNGEVFRILQQQFKLPPFPVANHVKKFLPNYFKLLEATQGSDNGRIEKIFRVEHRDEKPLEKAGAMASDSWNAFISSMILLQSPIIDMGIAAYDSAPSTIFKRTLPIASPAPENQNQ